MGALSLALTLAIYQGSRALYRRHPRLLLSPIFISPLALALILVYGGIDYDRYMEGGRWLSLLLSPATVALAVPMYKHRHLIRQYGLSLGLGVLLGSAAAIISSVLPPLLLGWDSALVISLAPRSVTTPIAMEIARAYAGEPVMAAVFVILTALLGLIIGPLTIRYLAIRSAIGKGVLFGMGAHGVGTARAFELGQVEGTVSSLSMILAAFVTLALIPLLLPLLFTVAP